MSANIRKLVRNMRAIDTKDALLEEAMDAMIRATNNLDPDCIFCGCDATPNGERHGPGCIITRIRTAIRPNAKADLAGGSEP